MTIKQLVKSMLSDKFMIQYLYWRATKKKLRLQNPQTFNEKLQWLKLYDRKEIYTTMVDKYEVKKYVANIIGKEYIIPTIGIYDNFADIDFGKLPNKFVMKCTHDSGSSICCDDKSKFNIKEAKKKINRCLKRNYYYDGREWPYKNVKPRIIVEEYMQNDNNADTMDYKFMCFNGKVKSILVCSNRRKNLNIDFYNVDWEKMPVQRTHKNSGKDIIRPKNYDTMIKLTEKLSKDISFLRVDWYEINGKLYFGELTFYPASGFEKFYPEEWDTIFGNWLELPELKIEEKHEK